MSILPPEVRAGYVYNRVLRAIGDRPEDEDRFPDGIPAKGTVTFTPKNSVKQVVSNNTGVTVTREPVVCTIHQGEDNPNLAGLLIDEAGAVGGVWLVVGEWTVSYQFEDRYSNVPNQDIVVTEEHTEENPLDVALVAGITPSPTIKFVVNEQIYIDSKRFRDEAESARDDAEQARDDATTAAGIADTLATDASTSATTAADILAQTQALGITVDTSVGTRVFVGNTMIHGDTGWRLVGSLVGTSVSSGDVFIRRTNDIVEVSVGGLMWNNASPGLNVASETITVGHGLTPRSYTSRPLMGVSDVDLNFFDMLIPYISSGRFYLRWVARTSKTGAVSGPITSSRPLSGSLTWTTIDPWPDSLPGTPA